MTARVTLIRLDSIPDGAGRRVVIGELDLAVLFDFPGQEGAGAREPARTALLEDPMFLTLPRTHRLAARRRLFRD